MGQIIFPKFFDLKMYKSVSYYDQIAESFLNESRTFSKAILDESLSAKRIYSSEGAVSNFDIFLSHSYLDKKTVYGIYKDFESLGYNTYVDWIVDPNLDRNKITKATAEILRTRMKQSKCLIYATSSNILLSNWMPWELGFMDGLTASKVAVFPLLKAGQKDADIELPKYLELYFSCTKEKESKSCKDILWINEATDTYISFSKWLYDNKQPYKRIRNA
jgi:hypothetical protein